jgi:hypothetical protein
MKEPKEGLATKHVGRLVGVHCKTEEEVKAAVGRVGGVYEEWMGMLAGRFARVAAVGDGSGTDGGSGSGSGAVGAGGGSVHGSKSKNKGRAGARMAGASVAVVTIKLPPGLLSHSDINHINHHGGGHAEELSTLDFANRASEQAQHNPMHGGKHGQHGQHGRKGKGKGKDGRGHGQHGHGQHGHGHGHKQTVHLNFGSGGGVGGGGGGGGGGCGGGGVPTTLQLPVDVLYWPTDASVPHLAEAVKRKTHLNRQIAELNKQRSSLRRHEDAICAFVTFNEEVVASHVLRYYESSTTTLGFWFQPREMRLELKSDRRKERNKAHRVSVV